MCCFWLSWWPGKGQVSGEKVSGKAWLNEVSIKCTITGIIKGDNRGAIALTKNTKDHGKVKHINIQHHYIQELLCSGAIAIEQVASSDNLADLFTKPLPCDLHHCLLTALNIQWTLLHSWGSIEIWPVYIYSHAYYYFHRYCKGDCRGGLNQDLAGGPKLIYCAK